MKLTILGSASAERYPALWCRCVHCQAARQRGGRDLRATSALLINDDLLIDAGPDLVHSAARLGCSLAAVQAALISHPHYDHLEPLTLLARQQWASGTPLPRLHLYAAERSLEKLGQAITQAGFEAADLRLRPARIAPLQSWSLTTGRDLRPDPRFPHFWAVRRDLPHATPRRYQIHSLPARHMQPADEAMGFVVVQTAGPELASRGGADQRLPAFLYLSDSGPLPEASWRRLEALAGEGLQLDAAILDATLALGHPGEDHCNLVQTLAHFRGLAALGLLAPGARRLAHHFSHYFTPPYAELAAILAVHGLEPTYDGMQVQLAG